MPKPPPVQVLDLGCGTGVVSQDLQSNSQTTSLDFNTQALAFCDERGLKRLIHGDAESLPFAANSFDAIVSLDVFEHLQQDECAFRESCRVLAPGGILVLSVPAFKSLWGPHDVALHHFRRYRKGEVAKKLEAAGFEMVRNSYSVFLLFPVVVLTRMAEKARRGPARASLPKVPKWMNSFLVWLQKLEAKLIVYHFDLPWGSSVVAVGRKPLPPKPDSKLGHD
jgi:SAM-dependent methyltransferase